MSTNLDDVRKHVALLSDESLLAVEREDLTEAALTVYEAELKSRGLAWPEEAPADEEPEGPIVVPGGGLVPIAQYDSVEEGRFARDLLRNEGIPAWFAGELALRKGDPDPLAGLQLLTQPSYLEQAQLLLSSEISDEELARQAEAAGDFDEIADEDPKDSPL